jgi:hypothetical protein
MRYLERMKKASLKQNQIYKSNLQKHIFMTEKEKYAKHLETDIYNVQLPINNKEETQMLGGRRIPLGKLVTQMEMRNPEAR